MRASSRLAPLLLLLTCATAHARDFTDDERAVLEWFDGLGFPDVTGKTFVRATTGSLLRLGSREPPVVETIEGFLLSDDGTAFEVLDADLDVRSIRYGAQEESDAPRAGWTAADFDAYARAVLSARSREPIGWMEAGLQSFLGQRGLLLALARQAASIDRTGLARDLLQAARELPEYGRHEVRPLLESARADLEVPYFWRLVLDFGKPEVSRAALVERYRRMVASFPDGRHTERAREEAALLERMVAEDEEHARNARPFETLSRDEQIADLVFRLRDQNGGQFSQPGWPTIWLSPRVWRDAALVSDTESPANALLAFGTAAVPALIEAIEDARFTRTVGYWRDFTFSHYVVRVGDAALEVLERISGRTFWRRTGTAASMWKDGHASETRKRVQQWWDDYRSKGEREFLVDTVREAGRDAVSALRQLVEEYPDAAADAFLGAMEVVSPQGRLFLLQEARAIDDPRVTELLVREVEEGPTLAGRLSAAFTAVERGHPEVVAAVFREWERFEPVPADCGGSWLETANLVAFLLRHGGVEGARAVARGLRTLPFQDRSNVVDDLPTTARDLDPAVRREVEDVLAKALEDDEGPFSRRIADRAADGLAGLWERPDAFPRDAPIEERDRAIEALGSEWRRRRGRSEPTTPTLREPDADLRTTRLRGVEIAPDSDGPPGITRGKLEALRDRPLDGAALVDLVITPFLRDAPGTVRLSIRWSPDGRGTRLRLHLRRTRESAGGTTWAIQGGEIVRGRGEGRWGLNEVHHDPPVAPTFAPFREAVDALASDPPEGDVRIELSVSRR